MAGTIDQGVSHLASIVFPIVAEAAFDTLCHKNRRL